MMNNTHNCDGVLHLISSLYMEFYSEEQSSGARAAAGDSGKIDTNF